MVTWKKAVKAYLKTNGRCYYCGTDDFETMSIDHMTPKAQGGTDDVDNLVMCCKSCNSRKRDKNIEQYRLYLENIDFPEFTKAQIEYLKGLYGDMPAVRSNPDRTIFYGEEREI